MSLRTHPTWRGRRETLCGLQLQRPLRAGPVGDATFSLMCLLLRVSQMVDLPSSAQYPYNESTLEIQASVLGWSYRASTRPRSLADVPDFNTLNISFMLFNRVDCGAPVPSLSNCPLRADQDSHRKGLLRH
jgi:hypothetical protein